MSTPIAVESAVSEAENVVAEVSTIAVIDAIEVAVTEIPPDALIVVPVTSAIVSAGFSSPMPSPSTASARLKRMFCESQPIELKASVTPIASSGDSTIVFISASSVDVLSALTVTLPPFATTAVPVTVAVAPLRITFVAIWNAIPFESFSSNGLPPLALAIESPVARIVAVSSAVTEKLPPAVAVMFSTFAKAPPRTSLRDASPEAAVASAELTFVRPSSVSASYVDWSGSTKRQSEWFVRTVVLRFSVRFSAPT